MVEGGGDGPLVVELWKFLVDGSNYFNVIVLDMLQVLLLKLLLAPRHLIVYLKVCLRVAVLLPLFEAKRVFLLVAKTPHHPQQQLEHHQHKNLPAFTLKQKTVHILQTAVQVPCIAKFSF